MLRRLGLLLATTGAAVTVAISVAGPAEAADQSCSTPDGCPGYVHKFSGWGTGQHNGWIEDTPGRRNVGG